MKFKPEKNSGLNGIRTLRYRCSALPTELSSASGRWSHSVTVIYPSYYNTSHTITHTYHSSISVGRNVSIGRFYQGRRILRNWLIMRLTLIHARRNNTRADEIMYLLTEWECGAGKYLGRGIDVCTESQIFSRPT